MLTEYALDISAEIEYARKWAFSQLGTGYFQHSLLVVGMRYGMPYVAAHTADAFHRPLMAYQFDRIRCMRIRKARKY